MVTIEEAPGRPAPEAPEEAEDGRIDGGSLDSKARRRQSASAASAAPTPTPPDAARAPFLAASSARTSDASSIRRVSGSIDEGVMPTEPRRSKRNWAGKVFPAAAPTPPPAPPPKLPPLPPPPPPNEEEELGEEPAAALLLSVGGSSPSAALAIALSSPFRTPESSLRSRAIEP